MKTITENPFRILGIFTNATERDVVSHLKKIKAYSRIGHETSFEADLCPFLPQIKRDAESADKAKAAINLTSNRLKHALFWLICVSDEDKTAISHLNNNETGKAKTVWDENGSYSSLINRAVVALIEQDYDTAVRLYTTLIHNDNYRAAFISSTCGEKAMLSEEEITETFFGTMIETVPLNDLVSACRKNAPHEDYAYVCRMATEGIISYINSAIELTKRAEDEAMAQYQAGEKLMNNTKDELQALKELLGGDEQYQLIADNVAQQIQTCAISYHNSSDDEDKAKKAYVLQTYALSVAEGHLVKESCRNNLDILEDEINEPLTEELNDIKAALDKIVEQFKSSENTVPGVIQLIVDCAPYLADIREVQGKKGRFYIYASTQLEELALGTLIDIINNCLNPSTYIPKQSIRDLLSEAWQALPYLEILDVTPASAIRLAEQKIALREIIEQYGETPDDYIAQYRLVSHAEKQRFHETISQCTTFDEAIKLLPECNDSIDISILDNKCFELCTKSSDYIKYIESFGIDAEHYDEARKEMKSSSLFFYRLKKFIWVFLIFAAVITALVGLGTYWGMNGFVTILWLVAGICGLSAFGLTEEFGCGTAIVLIVIAGAAIRGANYLHDQNEKEKYEEQCFRELQDSPTVDDCKIFLDKFPESSHEDEVLKICYSCAGLNDIIALNKMAEQYKTTEWGAKAREHVKEICDSLYNAASTENTLEAWAIYQQVVPQKYEKDSKQRIENIIEQNWSTEPEAWNQATKENTYASYELYLELYPDGEHKVEATDKMRMMDPMIYPNLNI